MKTNLAEDKYKCTSCVFYELKKCKGGGVCSEYLRVTPACHNCASLSSCSNYDRDVVCKRWEPDYSQPFIALLKSLNVSGDSLPLVGVIDDRDFKKAPNWITFCQDHLGIRPYPRQIQIAMNFLADFCPNPKCTNPKYLDLYDQGLGNILDNVSFLEEGICPKCKANRAELVKKKKFKDFSYYTELVGVAGQRASKSELAALIAAYVWQWYTKLPDIPSKFFGLTGNKIHMTFCALTFGQAKTDLWDPFNTHITHSWWFKEYHNHINSECQRLNIEPVIKVSETFMWYKHKNIQVAPVGPDKRILRGPTRFFTCIGGNTLVNTDAGLIHIKNNIIGNSASVDGNDYEITNWAFSGKKRLVEATTDFGYFVKGSKDHQILTINKNLDTSLKRLEDIQLGDYVAIDLGGSFPKKLCLDYRPMVEESERTKIHKQMLSLGTFKTPDIKHSRTKDSFYCVTSKLIKKGLLRKVYLKGIDSSIKGKTTVAYNITSKFSIEAAEGKGSIKDRKKQVKFPTHMSKALGYLLGYYVSNGSYNTNAQEFSFATSNKVVSQHFRMCFFKCFNVYPNSVVHTLDSGITMYYERVAYSIIKEFLRYVGLKPSTARIKSIPWTILQGPKVVAKAFLRSLFECDGCVVGSYVSYCSYSPLLLKQIQILLLKLNIISARRPKSSTDLRLPLYESITYMKKIGFITKGKNYNADCKKPGHFRQYKIPYIRYENRRGDSKYVWLKAEFNERDDFYALRCLYNNPERYLKAKKLLTMNYLWMPIVSKKQSKKKYKTYDISVNDKHLYSANGVVVSNSIDELGWFSGGKKAIKLNPDEVYRPLNNSLKTIRNASKKLRINSGLFNIPTAYAVNISSPSTSRDKIMRLLHASEKAKSMYGFHYATWEMNPEYTREDFNEEFQVDPIGAQRDFGAAPPLTDSPFISEPQVLLENTRPSKKNILVYSTLFLKTKSGASYVGATLDKIINPKCPVVVCLDAGYSRNAFGVSVISYNSVSAKAIIEGVLEVKPVDGKPVHFLYVYEHVIEPILDKLAVAAVFIDRWQSITIQQTIEDRDDAPCFIYSLKPQDFEYIRTHILRGDVLYPRSEIKEWNDIIAGLQDYEDFFQGKPVSHLLLQTATVQSIGKKVCKSGDLDDDLFRASALGIYFCLEDTETQETLALLSGSDSNILMDNRSSATLGMCRGMSEGSFKRLGSSSGQSGIGSVRSFGAGCGVRGNQRHTFTK